MAALSEIATQEQVIDLLRPALINVAPVGMSENDQVTWLVSTAGFLADVPIDLLRRAIHEIMSEVDHPAKIVKAIRTAIAGDMAFRRRQMTPVEIHVPPVEVKAIEDNATMPFEQVRNHLPLTLGIFLRQGWVTQEIYDRVLAERQSKGLSNDEA